MKTKSFKIIVLLLTIFLITSISCKGKCGTNSPTSITINLNQEEIYIGDTLELSVSVTPSDANCDVIWEVSNSNVSIDNQKLTALAVGNVTITATSKVDDKISTSKEITILKPIPQGIDLNYEDEITIYLDDTLEFNANITPSSASQEVEYFSSNENVAAFKDNILTAVTMGSTYVTIKAKDNPAISKSILVNVLHLPLTEEIYEAKNIIGALGEDASTMYHIHYHIMNTKSYALVTKATDENFTSATAYYGDGYYYENLTDEPAVKWEPRNIWNIDVTGLEENTEYIYKINNGDDTYSDIYHFKTAGGTSTSFLFVTDVHYYTGTTGELDSAAVSEETINQALKINPNISFVLNGGDLVDTGGNDDIWDIFFTYAQSLKKLPFVGVPGNHEYYAKEINSSTNEYFAVNNSAPLNGPKALLGASCWFIHNDTLFILMDNIRSTGYNEQLKWMQNLLENKTYKYSVVCFHKPVNYNNSDYDQNFLNMFDKYGVDLVLSGHYHGEGYFSNYYQGSQTTDPYLGTTYLTGAFGGIKSASSKANAVNEAKGYIIDITDEGITITTIHANGDIVETRNITNKAETPSEIKDKQELLDSITLEELTETNQVTFAWSKAFYGNVKKVTITETLRNELVDFSVFPSSSYQSLTFDNIVDGYDYNFEVEVIFNDGTKEIKTYILNKHIPVYLTASVTSETSVYISFDQLPLEIRYSIYEFKVYVNGEYHSSFYHQNGANTSYEITNLQANTEYEITIVACKRGDLKFFTESVSIKTSK